MFCECPVNALCLVMSPSVNTVCIVLSPLVVAISYTVYRERTLYFFDQIITNVRARRYSIGFFDSKFAVSLVESREVAGL